VTGVLVITEALVMCVSRAGTNAGALVRFLTDASVGAGSGGAGPATKVKNDGIHQSAIEHTGCDGVRASRQAGTSCKGTTALCVGCRVRSDRRAR
jgi:hypothetical protein